MSYPEPAPDEFSRGSVLPGVAAGCALPVVGVLLAFLLGLGLIIWSGSRSDDEASAPPAVEALQGHGDASSSPAVL